MTISKSYPPFCPTVNIDLKVLCNETNIETVLSMLVIADRHGAAKLKEVCVKFLVENCHTVVQQCGWKEMLEPYPALLAGTENKKIPS